MIKLIDILRHKKPVYIPRFDLANDFGLGTKNIKQPDGSTWFRCDACGKYKPDVSISPGDGYAECESCFKEALESSRIYFENLEKEN